MSKASAVGGNHEFYTAEGKGIFLNMVGDHVDGVVKRF